MGVELKRLNPIEHEAMVVAALGLDAEALDLTAPEVLAESIRRAAAVRCPCRRSTLTRAVEDLFRGRKDTPDFLHRIGDTVDTLIAFGDLLETQGEEDHIHLGPLRFVRRQSGTTLLLGGVPDHGLPLPEHFQERIDRVAHVRRLRLTSGEEQTLKDFGFVEILASVWEKAPIASSANIVAERYVEMLDMSGPSGSVEIISVLDAGKSPKFYSGRWISLRHETGVFVAKRRGQFGDTRWCFIRTEGGVVVRYLALPTVDEAGRAVDEAWRLQAALDASNKRPQVFRVTESDNVAVFELFSPVPRWVQRRWDSVGERLVDRKGCLFAYRFDRADAAEEGQYLKDYLWMAEEGRTP